jgi:hypothetical protein
MANGFTWPESGYVEAKDFNTVKDCGGGLHGLLWGKGSISYLLIEDPDAKWLVFVAEAAEVVEIDSDKAKAKRGVVLFCGAKEDAVRFLYGHELYQDKHCVGVLGTATAGVLGTATAGDGGTATAGNRGTATAGNMGTATAGDRGTATAGDGGTIAIGCWNGKRYKYKIATIKDEDGRGELKPNVKYRLNFKHEFEEVA